MNDIESKNEDTPDPANEEHKEVINYINNKQASISQTEVNKKGNIDALFICKGCAF